MFRRSSSRRSSPVSRSVRPTALRPGARPGGGGRRTRPVRRASAGLTPVRAGALLALVAAVAATWGLASSDVFSMRHTVVTGATWTPEDSVLAALAIPEGANVFTLKTADLGRAVMALPSVRSASVTVALPDKVTVAVDERVALVAWKVGGRKFLVDGDGLLFGELDGNAPPEAATLPVIDDARLASMALDVGSTLDPVTLDAALRLGSLTPADVGSTAKALVLRVDDTVGFAMRTRPVTWTAIFGFYTPTLRTTDLIPGQVRLLNALLAGREGQVAKVILADDQSGTYVPKDTPAPTKKPKG